MKLKYYNLFFLLSASIAVLSFNINSQASKVLRKECLSLNNSYQCYCSQVCKFRDKTKEDSPVFVENDPHKKFCYCKKWDKDNFRRKHCSIKD